MPNFAVMNLGVHPITSALTAVPPIDNENLTNNPQYLGNGVR